MRPDLEMFKTRISRFRYYVQHVLPQIYDDSLSYIELLDKVIQHLNEIGQVTNDMLEKWNEVYEWILNEGLKEAVENKLDELLKNGELAKILYEILDGVHAYGYDVHMAGVKGDGVTNNTAKITELNNSDYDILFFRRGTYIMDVAPTKLCFGYKATLIINGLRFKLGVTAQQANSIEQVAQRLNNTIIGVNAGDYLNDNPETSYGNTAYGNMALNLAQNSRRNTAIGCDALAELVDGYSATAVGVGANQWGYYNDRSTFVGGNVAKTLGAINLKDRHPFYTACEALPALDQYWPDWRTYAGDCSRIPFVPTSKEDVTSNVGVGRNAMGYNVTTKRSVGIGYNAMEQTLDGDGIVAIGENAHQYGLKSKYSTFVGGRAGWRTSESEQDTVVGKSAMQEIVHSRQNTAIGYQALGGLKADHADYPKANVAIGRISMANSIGSVERNTAVGENTLTNVQSNANTAVGNSAGSNLKTGEQNTFLGTGAGNLLTTANRATAVGYNALNTNTNDGYENITGVGQNSSVSGSNQVQLGNSSATPYAFNALQVRSDRRDKTEIRDLDLLTQIEFMKLIDPKKYKMKFRESTHDSGEVGKRDHYGFIAQDVKEAMDFLGIDFAGFQDHSVNGGKDVLSLGYQEFIPVMWKVIQNLLERVEKLEAGRE
ncbi:tail fiber domain-containing protein [Bacillus altitudinis]|uniref:tail fiber domain-containing protein n=1 Tax=Bacillus altitudinis TaxID=293387 RepID=UPI003D23A172